MLPETRATLLEPVTMTCCPVTQGVPLLWTALLGLAGGFPVSAAEGGAAGAAASCRHWQTCSACSKHNDGVMYSQSSVSRNSKRMDHAASMGLQEQLGLQELVAAAAATDKASKHVSRSITRSDQEKETVEISTAELTGLELWLLVDEEKGCVRSDGSR